ncbi:MAG: EthD domain-containing protein [Candidatus Thiodiazotropha sp. (ex Dulcina madagascariensis)]|nr:EthD domain-containing protein [Candidatus Thiodiazotropha sp. (ex Epidulcina cf. delphinae)]MCU7922833.1 EthD domain-containing protein [Candidatus Thiodiazotropha sp. (ex Dulcina madagascariensis)]
MIHQLIFAHPKPGMSEPAFQDYWVNIHAVNYASKITQIRRYMVDTRVPCGPEPEDPLFSGVGEIWIENEEEQLASLQSKAFLEGARPDEPRWAAFWRTVVLDTTAHVMMEGPPLSRDASLVKLFVLVKRKPGMPLNDFRSYALETHAPKVLGLPGLRRYYQCHVRDGCYTIGETLLDAAFMLWFDDVAAIERMWESPEYKQLVEPDLSEFTELKYIHTMATEEHWVIGPAFR